MYGDSVTVVSYGVIDECLLQLYYVIKLGALTVVLNLGSQ